MENQGDQLEKPISREEVTEILNDGGEHKFLVDPEKGPIYVVGISREKEKAPRLHEHLRQTMIEKRIFTDPDKVRGGYCKVVDNTLLFWGGSSYPVKGVTEKVFEQAANTNGFMIIDQWLGEPPTVEK